MYCICVISVGGLTSPVKGSYTEPLDIANKPPDSLQHIDSSVHSADEEHQESVDNEITVWRSVKEWDVDDDEEDEEADFDKSERGKPLSVQRIIPEPNHKITTVPELELRKLERGEVSLSFLIFFLWQRYRTFQLFLIAFFCLFLCRFLPVQSVSASFSWEAGATPIMSQQWPVFQSGAMGQKGTPKFTIEYISELLKFLQWERGNIYSYTSTIQR